jgi:hypothetical protein
MRSGFWRKCRVCFRWCRISVWLVVLAAICGVLWLNRIGLPDFLKTRLLATLHERGIELSFTRMRLRFDHGIVAENVRIGGAQAGTPVLTLAEVQVQLDFPAMLRRQWQVKGLMLRQGKLVWPVSPTNELQLDNIQTFLRFQTNDTWSLQKFQADFAGAQFRLGGEIAHAPALRDWKIFRGSGSTNFPAWPAQLRRFSDTLDRIHFEGTPELNLAVNGDARDFHTFVIRLMVSAPAARTPWFRARDLQLSADLAIPAGMPAEFDPAWGFWTNLQPFQLEWSASATGLESEKLNAESVACAGLWRAPELTITNLSARLGGGWLEAGMKLNVATRQLTFTNNSSFDLHAVDALLTGKTDERLAEFSWTQPPVIQVAGSLVLPAWTNSHPDWEETVRPTVHLTGALAFTNGTVLGAHLDSARTHFSYLDLVWQLPDLAVAQAKTRLDISGFEDDATKKYRWRIRGVVDPEVARPFLTTSNALRGFEIVKISRPLVLDVGVSGRLYDYDDIAVDGLVAATNLSVRGEQFGDVTTELSYTNRVLAFVHPLMHSGEQMARADSVTLDFNAGRIYFTNILSVADPEPVARAIGPKTGKLVEPYHFLSTPTARVNGQIPLGDLHGGPEMADVDMRFDVLKGGPFEWLRLRTTNIVGTLHWRGQTLLLTNVAAAFYGGSGAGFADFDFRVPHEGADYHYAVSVTNVNLHLLAVDLAGPTNHLEGNFSGIIVVTNASTEDWRTLSGLGRVNLHDGLLWDIPIFGILSPVLNTFSPGLGNSRATDASARFVITNGVIYSDSLEINSLMARLEYVGGLNLKTVTVDAHVTAQLLRNTWVVGPLVSTVLWPVSKLFEYHVTGPLTDPRSEPIYVLPKLLLLPLHPIRTLQEMIPSGDSLSSQPPGS